MSELNNKNIRERQLTIMLKLYYDRFPVLQKESLEDFTKKNLEYYLNSDLSIDDINDQLAKKYISQKEEDEDHSLEEMVTPVEEKKEKGFQLIKKNNNIVMNDNEEGYISNMIITTLALMTFSLCCIGLIVLYLIK